jgi:hypothetical protein
MGSSFGIAVLVVAFVILLWTFLWVAKLMSHREKPRVESLRKDVSALVEEDDGEAEAEEEDQPEIMRGRGSGANYGLLLGGLSCGLFFLTQTPLLLALSCVGFFYSVRALVRGLRYFRVVVWRALLGVLLNVASLAMHILFAVGQWPLPVLDVGAGLL